MWAVYLRAFDVPIGAATRPNGGKPLELYHVRRRIDLRCSDPEHCRCHASANSSIAQLRNVGRADGRSRVTPTGTLMIDDCGEVDVIQEILKGRHR